MGIYTNDLVFTLPLKAIGNYLSSFESLVSNNMVINNSNWFSFDSIKDFHLVNVNVHFEIRGDESVKAMSSKHIGWEFKQLFDVLVSVS